MAIIPDKTTKLYYSIKEVGEMFGLNDSTLRYWEKEFPFLKPKVAGNKVRQYTDKDIEQVRIQFLRKEEVFMKYMTFRWANARPFESVLGVGGGNHAGL